MIKKTGALTAAAVLLLSISACGTIQKTEPVRPNVIIITIDALRPSHLGCYGYTPATSPHIDKFAREGALFKNAITAAPWSLPSITSLFTSLYTTTHRVVEQNMRLGPELKPLSQILREHGYQTGAFTGVSGFCGAFYHGRGFEVYHDATKSAPELTQIATQWLAHVKDGKFFAFIHYFDVHSDYNPPPPYDTMYDTDYAGTLDGRTETLDKIFKKELAPTERDLEHIRALYDGGITYTDTFIGQLLARIDALGLRDNTLIIISADHGEEIFEHGMTVHRQLYDETIKVPLIMRLPGRIPQNKVIASQVRSIDIMPTILDILNISLEQTMQGTTLMDSIDGRETRDRAALVETEKYGRLRALRADNEWKLIYSLQNKSAELYNLKQDPHEKENLTEKEPQKAAALEKDMFAQMRRNNLLHAHTAERLELSQEQLEQLRSLGYAQ